MKQLFFTRRQGFTQHHFFAKQKNGARTGLPSTTFEKNKSGAGFTIIELLVVIAIIGVITSIVISNLSVARAKARDTRRVSDIVRIQLALQLYFDRCHEYPSTLNVSANNSLGGTCVVTFGDFISQIPIPPLGTSEVVYAYSPDPTETDYVLRTKFEYGSPALADSFNGSIPWNPGFNSCVGSAPDYYCCDRDAPNYYYCARPK